MRAGGPGVGRNRGEGEDLRRAEHQREGCSMDGCSHGAELDALGPRSGARSALAARFADLMVRAKNALGGKLGQGPEAATLEAAHETWAGRQQDRATWGLAPGIAQPVVRDDVCMRCGGHRDAPALAGGEVTRRLFYLDRAAGPNRRETPQGLGTPRGFVAIAWAKRP